MAPENGIASALAVDLKTANHFYLANPLGNPRANE
jgi:hypothetical protein